MIAIFKRELRAYFQTPIGYIFMGLFMLIAAFFFANINLFGRSPNFTGFLGSILFIYLFAVPLLTMRLLSEERRLKTDQLLLTAPISVASVVVGKYLAALVVFLITLLITVAFAVTIAVVGDLAFAETFGAYIGFFLIGASFVSLGVFVSAVTENQSTAAFFTFFALLFVWLIDIVKSIVPRDAVAGLIFAIAGGVLLAFYLFSQTRHWIVAVGSGVVLVGAAVIVYAVQAPLFTGLIESVLAWFSLLERVDGFLMGLFRLEDVVFYLSFIGVFLFLTVRVVEKRRWS